MSKLLNHLRDLIQVRDYSIRSEQAYLRWTKQYIFFHKKRHAAEMGEKELTEFLSGLGVQRKGCRLEAPQAKA